MTKPDLPYEPHLELCEVSLAPGNEWTPRPSDWSLCQVHSGTGYWLHPFANQELPLGTLILQKGQGNGSIRASQLGLLSIYFFYVEPRRLTGLLSLREQILFETSPGRENIQILPPSNPVALKMQALCAGHSLSGCLLRLQLVELFLEIFETDLRRQIRGQESVLGVKHRLRALLDLTPAADLLNLSTCELSQKMRCTRRHLSRAFHEVVGVPFREKQAQLRLLRACELLAASDSKIVDVALESGFQSLSPFNMIFRRRFGVSPGKWAQGRRANKRPKAWFARPTRQSNRFQSSIAVAVPAGSSPVPAGISPDCGDLSMPAA